jgi:hypothetical protein
VRPATYTRFATTVADKPKTHGWILKRVGGVLVAVGLIDIAVMIYCIANQISYSSSFNIFAVIAGGFLLRGSLRAASLVRWFAVFIVAVFISALISLPFVQPLDLTLTQIRLEPVGSLAIIIAFVAFVLGILLWISKELGRQPVQAALISARIKGRDIRIPAAAGVGLVVVVSIFLVAFLQLSGSAERARSIAEQQVGTGYRFHVRSLNVVQNNQGKSVSGVVIGWNEKEIKTIPVHWRED